MESILQSGLFFVADDPLLRFMQICFVFLGTITVFLVFYTAKDVLLRTRLVVVQILCVLLVTVLPIVGFFLYLLLRPSRTLKEREIEKMLNALLKKEGSH